MTSHKKIIKLTIIIQLLFFSQVSCSYNKKPNEEKIESTIAIEQTEKVKLIKLDDNHWKTYTEIIIDAPSEEVWNTLMDYDNIPNWSSSFQGIKGELINGNKVIINYLFNGELLKIPHTLIYKEGEEFGWSDPLKGKLEGFTDNHKYIVEKISNSQTRFIQTDDFKNTGASNLTSHDIANLTSKAYPKFNRELKLEVEKKK